MEFSRPVQRKYADPLDRVWLTTAGRLGFRVERTTLAYATTDGAGTIGVGTPETLDADDCLAQILFHELCHALVQGTGNHAQPDWGLCNETERDQFREHACLRLQASLAGRHGLRELLAPTTDYRTFYDALPADPLAGDDTDPSLLLARAAKGRADDGPWRMAIDDALRATAAITAAARTFAVDDDLLATAPQSRVGRHPIGAPLGPLNETCGTCAWFTAARGKDAAADAGSQASASSLPTAGQCRMARRRPRPRLYADSPSCFGWEATLDCQTCGACCREAYGAVEIGPREPVRKRHPELIVQFGPRLGIRREGARCAALEGDAQTRFSCSIYPDRPKTCRDFERGGNNCLDARQRVHLSRRPPP